MSIVVRTLMVAGLTASGITVGLAAARVGTVAVAGPSMVPTLHHGDALVTYATHRIRPGDVVIARFSSRPDLLVVKRAVRPYRGGWWIEGDNPLITDDSRKYGRADVLARVLFRYWPAPALSRCRTGRRPSPWSMPRRNP